MFGKIKEEEIYSLGIPGDLGSFTEEVTFGLTKPPWLRAFSLQKNRSEQDGHWRQKKQREVQAYKKCSRYSAWPEAGGAELLLESLWEMPGTVFCGSADI